MECNQGEEMSSLQLEQTAAIWWLVVVKRYEVTVSCSTYTSHTAERALQDRYFIQIVLQESETTYHTSIYHHHFSDCNPNIPYNF